MSRTIYEIEEAFRASPTVILTAEEKALWNSYCSIERASNTQKRPQSPPIAEVLVERGTRYGPFAGHASLTQDIKRAMRGELGHGAAYGSKWKGLTDSQREALEMIAHKIGRILNGDPNYLDSWVDIVGYTQLVIDELQEKAK